MSRFDLYPMKSAIEDGDTHFLWGALDGPDNVRRVANTTLAQRLRTDLGENWTDLGNLGATETITPTTGVFGRKLGTLDQNCTITLALDAGETLELFLVQGGAGGFTPTFSGMTDWFTIDGNAPNLSTRSPGDADLFYFFKVGAALYGIHSTDSSRLPWAVPFKSAASTLTLTNQAAALQFIGNVVCIQPADLTGFKQVKFSVHVLTASASAATPKVILRYLTTASTTAADYLDIATVEANASLAATGLIETAWLTLATAARTNVYLTVLQSGGDAAADPALGSVTAQFR